MAERLTRWATVPQRAYTISRTVWAVGAFILIWTAKTPNRMIWIVAPAAYLHSSNPFFELSVDQTYRSLFNDDSDSPLYWIICMECAISDKVHGHDLLQCMHGVQSNHVVCFLSLSRAFKTIQYKTTCLSLVRSRNLISDFILPQLSQMRDRVWKLTTHTWVCNSHGPQTCISYRRYSLGSWASKCRPRTLALSPRCSCCSADEWQPYAWQSDSYRLPILFLPEGPRYSMLISLIGGLQQCSCPSPVTDNIHSNQSSLDCTAACVEVFTIVLGSAELAIQQNHPCR